MNSRCIGMNMAEYVRIYIWYVINIHCILCPDREGMSIVRGMASASQGCCADVSSESLNHCVACLGPLM